MTVIHTRLQPMLRYLAFAVLLFIVLVAFLCFWAPDTYEIGADEGFEVLKAQLVNAGFDLYSEIWNDQPALYTLLIASAFRIFGENMFVARAITAGFTTILVMALIGLIWDRAQDLQVEPCTEPNESRGRFYMFAIVFLTVCCVYLGFPNIFEISISAMLEVPAYSMGTVAMWILARPRSKQLTLKMSGVSGVVMALALNIKLTVALLLPVSIVLIALSGTGSLNDLTTRRRTVLVAFARAAIVHFGVLTVVYLVVALVTQRKLPYEVYMSHFSAGIAANTGNEYGYTLQFSNLANGLWIGILSLVLFIVATLTGTWIGYLPAVSLFATSLIVHYLHRPWWYYYSLHFCIPIAWILGIGIMDLLYSIHRGGIAGVSKGRVLVCLVVGVVLLGIVSLAFEEAMLNIARFVDKIDRGQSVGASKAIEYLKSREVKSGWMYSDNPIVAFYAHGVPPPEIAVLPLKRFWSGAMTEDRLVSILEKREVNTVVLSTRRTTGRLYDWTTNGFAVKALDERNVVFERTFRGP